ncbi:amino acid synthesis family protein [Pseudoflavonifractor phocaeensis]|uniref:amino acid synthesis family protein n=1 Tax=Pseudoflavonifractor phocaeensis TaxID=1870988 RepID=UPI00210CE87A|nr:amino acid synthesis family protein [Pseudoflavonifractor phocaeensis]MCQ4862954.1 amino acid synthesis family protein [Pseudoflavonifractor phocaeensis]
MDIRKIVTIRERSFMEGGVHLQRQVGKIAVMAVVRDPHPGAYVEDVQAYIDFGHELGCRLTGIAVEEFGREQIESFGKGAVVGADCELEHGAAMNHVRFGNAIRTTLGYPCKTIIPSTITRGGPGAVLTVPLVHREANLVRSHFDAMTVQIPDAPAGDEIVVVAAFGCGGRPLSRLGGLSKDDIVGDGIR